MKYEQKQYKMGSVYLVHKLTVFFPTFIFPFRWRYFERIKLLLTVCLGNPILLWELAGYLRFGSRHGNLCFYFWWFSAVWKKNSWGLEVSSSDFPSKYSLANTYPTGTCTHFFFFLSVWLCSGTCFSYWFLYRVLLLLVGFVFLISSSSTTKKHICVCVLLEVKSATISIIYCYCELNSFL